MLMFYPEIKPYARHQIAVDAPHELYVDESGNPDGIPVLFVHGGPGAGCGKYDRRFFDPELYRIILFDQRGCGRSTPHAELGGNNTQALVADIEKIRLQLGVDKWVVFGGSWGSTLSLVYAEAYPEHVLGLILRGIFLCRDQDLHWFYQHGASSIFPDYWQDFLAPIPEGERGDLMSAYYQRLTSDNELQMMSAAKAWSLWEGRCATLRPNQDVVDAFSNPFKALALAKIEAHYFTHKAFLQDNQILANADKLSGIPGMIVHGRYDMVCPLDNAFALQKAWPEAELQIIRDAGHASREAGIVDALIRATDAMARKLRNDTDQMA
ncbi:prolyl aminopeptidase [Gilvimarinus agarilyticus]|uniref:prolyl aminopeptidase n=1 Tax=unclassified Gilvimarinus TaxID=2642066 RepID=UPI001C0A2085|nr:MULTISPECIES: prolyl aminopeptidase [unclassified Gilvimarinus]MBU2885594.1 prolyl aminopeptidase [Gilvimarinus agarilyticus]MDO6570461.1 prolyl aminopeptidase [Gilvimarinus sp. 2_MG-2023]MDO6746512.1 prolyl aminopeptidase [Gilvimarinus sp. 1_MG-2023]